MGVKTCDRSTAAQLPGEMMRAERILLPFTVFALVACADLSPGPSETGANMNRYVAMGTSVSMGVASDGVVALSQQAAWPALLAADVGTQFGLR